MDEPSDQNGSRKQGRDLDSLVLDPRTLLVEDDFDDEFGGMMKRRFGSR